MSSQNTIPLRLWLKWKSLKLPWRRKWLCGQDLTGATFWEFHNALSPPSKSRPRRIVQYPRHMRTHLSDVNLSPAWLQWLRHTRPEPPSLEEQRSELARVERVKVLAERADERWRRKESWLDDPRRVGQNVPSLGTTGTAREAVRRREEIAGADDEVRDGGKVAEAKTDLEAVAHEKRTEDARSKRRERDKGGGGDNVEKENPWKKHSRGPSEEWQPESWTPGKVQRR